MAATMTVVNVTQTTATVESYGAGKPTATRYWFFRCNNETKMVSNKSTSASVTFTGLSPGTFYTAECKYGPDKNNPKYDGGSITFYTNIDFATSDNASYNYSESYTNVDLSLYNITSRNYPRTVTFEWYNTSSGGSEQSTETLLANTTQIPRSMKNLTSGTTYRFRITLANPNGVTTYDSGYFYVTTKAYATSDSGSYSYTAGPTNVHLYLTYITSRDYDRTVYYYWENMRTGGSGEKNEVLAANKTSNDKDMINLTMGDQYKFRIYVKNPAGNITYDSDYFYVTISDYTLSMTLSSTYNSVTVTVTLNKTLSYDVDLTVQLDGGRDLEIDINAGSITRSRTWTSGITAATGYTVTLIDNLRNKRFTSKKRTKNNFSWSTNVSSGKKFNLKADDWNEMTSQLKAKCSYYGFSPSDYSELGNGFSTAVKGRNLTAVMYNQAVHAINILVDNNKGDCVTSISEVSKGSPVTASCIKKLATCLNE